ncbi:MAG: carbon-nitrogen hydrolase family protein [Anaerolineae bacterium]|nr:carbon-nitrogen hydrolase family protein [Anaerolineae bacterium]
MTRTLTLCTVQPQVLWGDPGRTFSHLEALLAEATAAQAVDLVVLPEHFNAVLEEPGQTTRQVQAWSFAADLARRFAVNLVAGSVERWEGSRQGWVNTAVVFDRAGRELGRYDKRKLFGFERKRGVLPGQGPLVVDLEGVRCAVLICADLWYPELVREVADADVLCVPAQTVIRPESAPAYARLLWHSLALARGEENVMAVAVSDHAVGSVGPYRCGGVATLVDPSAEPDLDAIQRTLPEGRAGYLVATVDLDKLAAFRRYRRENGLLP